MNATLRCHDTQFEDKEMRILNIFVRPELARAVHKSKGFIFSSTDRLTWLVNSLLCVINIFQRLYSRTPIIRTWEIKKQQGIFEALDPVYTRRNWIDPIRDRSQTGTDRLPFTRERSVSIRYPRQFGFR